MNVLVKSEGEVGGKRSSHNSRVYVLLDVLEGHSGHVASILRGKPGVVTVDVLEEQPGVIMVVEAQHRLGLAEMTIQALASVEALIDRMHLMPIEDQRVPMVVGEA